MKLPRIMLAAPASGSGKTMITCGILQALQNREMKVKSFKCGPDYIDPMFHQQVLGTCSKNLDSFFTSEEILRYLFAREASKGTISILEGVMGYYDGAGGVTTTASSYELAKLTDTPVILIINAKGMSLSLIPLIQGFVRYEKDSHIKGVILNQISAGTYHNMKEQIEKETDIKVIGYVPICKEIAIESRYLGLMMPNEIANLKEKLQKFAKILEETLQLDQLLEYASEASEFTFQTPSCLKLPQNSKERALRIGVAKDEAFCFLYQDNLELLEEMGAELVYFSPLWEQQLPEKLDGLLFPGGYPELYLEQLSENDSMKEDVRHTIEQGTPYLAECGGFLYLLEELKDRSGTCYPMGGALKGTSYATKKLGKFGYITLSPKNDNQILKKGETIKAHEFHYFDTNANGTDYHGTKPFGNKKWDCMQGENFWAAGFPHLYYYSNPKFAYRFLEECMERRK
ncbi:MAG: cobyrinate a,c-diamide synthase [Lachnospiraceae bacterium]